jgi:hypothetical protein
LTGKVDKYKGLTISEDSVVTDSEKFRQQMIDSVKKWESEGIRGVWLKLSENNAHLIDIALKEVAFKFHHAKEGYVMMTKWMDKQMINKMPSFATHYIGVGGLVLNKDRTKILAIQE